MKVTEFINEFKTKKIQNTKATPTAIEDFIRSKLKIKTYLPFRDKCELAHEVVQNNIELVDGIKKYDNINSYICFIISTIITHTNLEFSEDVVSDYDLLAENGVLPFIIAEFKQSYDECDALLKMEITYELEDNNISAIMSKFLNSILDMLDGVVDDVKQFAANLDLSKILGEDLNKEDIAKIVGFLDKVK